MYSATSERCCPHLRRWAHELCPMGSDLFVLVHVCAGVRLLLSAEPAGPPVYPQTKPGQINTYFPKFKSCTPIGVAFSEAVDKRPWICYFDICTHIRKIPPPSCICCTISYLCVCVCIHIMSRVYTHTHTRYTHTHTRVQEPYRGVRTITTKGRTTWNIS